MPSSIVIRSISTVNSNFHPWYNIDYKQYNYRFFIKRPSPFNAPFGWYYPYTFDIDTLYKALQLYKGTHDFRSFITGAEQDQSTICTIYDINLSFNKNMYCYSITIKGNRFMRYMIRRIVGAALYTASHPNGSIALLKQILQNQNPHHKLPKAPALGLTLQKIKYK